MPLRAAKAAKAARVPAAILSVVQAARLQSEKSKSQAGRLHHNFVGSDVLKPDI